MYDFIDNFRMTIRIILLVLLACAVMARALAPQCSVEQITSLETLEMLTATLPQTQLYLPSKKMEVTYSCPPKSNIASIASVELVGDATFKLSSEDDLPVFTDSEETEKGSFKVQLPKDLSNGNGEVATNFLLRITLSLEDESECYIETAGFAILDDRYEECLPGTRVCMNDNQLRLCTSSARWSKPFKCHKGETCVDQAYNLAQCILDDSSKKGKKEKSKKNRKENCILGGTRCISSTVFQYCQAELDGSSHWKTKLPCGDGFVCQESLTGFEPCVAEQIDDSSDERNDTIEKQDESTKVILLSNSKKCTPLYMRCDTDNSFQTCSMETSDVWQWGKSLQCQVGSACKSYMKNYIICS